jgi:hypothetical protein
MYWRPWRWTEDGWFGAWIAILCCGVIAEVGFFANLALVTVAGLTGLLAGTLVAGRHAGHVLAGRSFVVEGLGVGFRAGILSLVGWWVALSIGTILFQTEYPFPVRLMQVVYGLVGIPTYGALLGGPFALLGGIVGALLLRTARRFGRTGTRLLAVASMVVAVIGIDALITWL